MTASAKALRGFLRQIVTDAFDDSVRAFAGELLGVSCSIRGWRNAIGITIKGDRGHRDDGTFGKSLFEIVVLWVAFSEAQPPAIIVDDAHRPLVSTVQPSTLEFADGV